MSDRLDQLRRQRALVQEHLAWLDREIATASGNATLPSAASLSTSPGPVVSRPVPAATDSSSSGSTRDPVAAAEAILEDYRVPPEKVQSNVKVGCLLYSVAAFALLGLIVVGLYFAFRHGR